MDKRQEILKAAERVFRAKGLAKATTRDIARDAGCAEGTLYVHFDDRLALFSAVLDECLPDFKESLEQLESLAGKRTVRANLEMVGERYIGFLQRAMSAVCSLFGEPELLEAHRNRMRQLGKGPRASEAMVIEYLRAEQKLGRLDRRAPAESLSSMLIGACFYQVFVSQYVGVEMHPEPEAFVRKLVDSVLRAARPSARASVREPEFSCAD